MSFSPALISRRKGRRSFFLYFLVFVFFVAWQFAFNVSYGQETLKRSIQTDTSGDFYWVECAGSDVEAIILGCTQFIYSGSQSANNLAFAYYNRGSAYARKGQRDSTIADLERAIADFDQAIRLRPHYSEAYNNRGLSYYHKGEYDRAISDFNQAIRLNPNDAEAYQNRGRAYSEIEELELAINDYDQAIRLQPTYADAYNNRGTIFATIGEFALAIADFDKSIKIEQNASAYYNRGSAYSEMGKLDLAINDFAAAIALAPDDPDAYYGRGTAYARKREYDRAISDLGQSIRLEPRLYEAFGNRGNAYLAKGMYDLAIADFDQAVRIYPDYGYAYYGRANAYFEIGNIPKALVDFRVAASLIPANDPWRDAALGRVEEITLKLVARPTLPSDFPAAFTNGGIVVQISPITVDKGKITEINVSGEFKAGDVVVFRNALLSVYGDNTPVVILDSPGGDLAAGIAMGETIWMDEMATVVLGGDTCASACALAWLAGRPRMMQDNASIGFHAAYVPDEDHASSAGSALMGSYLARFGFKSDTIRWMTEPGPTDELRWLTPEDARRLGISYDIWEGDWQEPRP